MTDLEAAIRQIHAGLRETGAPFALIGGLAVSVRTEPRFTRDADFVVGVASDAEAEALIRSLRGYRVTALVEQEAVGRLATVRLTAADMPDAPIVDLLFASSGIESEVAAEAELLEVLPGLELPIAQTGHLLALKMLSRDDEHRPQDLVDLRALLRVASADQRSARSSRAGPDHGSWLPSWPRAGFGVRSPPEIDDNHPLKRRRELPAR